MKGLKAAFGFMIAVLIVAIIYVGINQAAIAGSNDFYQGSDYSEQYSPTCDITCPACDSTCSACPACEPRVEYKYVTVVQYQNATEYVNVTKYVCANGTVVNAPQECMWNATNVTTTFVLLNYGRTCLSIFNVFDSVEQDDNGLRYKITGLVKNNCMGYGDFIRANFRLFDSTGRLMKDDYAITSPSSLEPGGQSYFSKYWYFRITATSIVPQDIPEKPTRVEMYATG